METTGLGLIVTNSSYSTGVVFAAVCSLRAVYSRGPAFISGSAREKTWLENSGVADSVRIVAGRGILVHICVSGGGGNRQGVFAAAF